MERETDETRRNEWEVLAGALHAEDEETIYPFHVLPVDFTYELIPSRVEWGKKKGFGLVKSFSSVHNPSEPSEEDYRLVDNQQEKIDEFEECYKKIYGMDVRFVHENTYDECEVSGSELSGRMGLYAGPTEMNASLALKAHDIACRGIRAYSKEFEFSISERKIYKAEKIK